MIIAPPNDAHTAIGIQCAKAGLNFLVEKPIDSDPANAVRQLDAVESAGVEVLNATMAAAEAPMRTGDIYLSINPITQRGWRANSE